MHPSLLSMIISAVRQLLVGPESTPAPPPQPRSPVRKINYDEREMIFARSHEVTARVSAIPRRFTLDFRIGHHPRSPIISRANHSAHRFRKIGRASCRERVEMSVVAVV